MAGHVGDGHIGRRWDWRRDINCWRTGGCSLRCWGSKDGRGQSQDGSERGCCIHLDGIEVQECKLLRRHGRGKKWFISPSGNAPEHMTKCLPVKHFHSSQRHRHLQPLGCHEVDLIVLPWVRNSNPSRQPCPRSQSSAMAGSAGSRRGQTAAGLVWSELGQCQ